MQDENHVNPADRIVESALCALRPAGAPGGRESMLFEAGRRRGQSQARRWQGVSAALTAALTISLLSQAFVPATSRGPTVKDAPPQGIYVMAPARERQDDPSTDKTGNRYLELRERVLARGIHALPEAPPSRTTWDDVRPAGTRALSGPLQRSF